LRSLRPSAILGYAVSGLVSVFGVLVLTGVVVKEGMPPKLQITFGVVLLLFGIYRFAVTRMRSSRIERVDE
jgi:hypothetical protein